MKHYEIFYTNDSEDDLLLIDLLKQGYKIISSTAMPQQGYRTNVKYILVKRGKIREAKNDK